VLDRSGSYISTCLSPATPWDNGQRTSPPLREGDGDSFSMSGCPGPQGEMSRFLPPLWMLRASAWFCVALIAVLSLIPHEAEVRTALPSKVEHVIAYAGTAGLLRLAYPSWAGWRTVAVLVVYGISLEGLQGFASGRSPGIGDALASGVGAVLGATGAALLAAWL
jgi:VanZ family protein